MPGIVLSACRTGILDKVYQFRVIFGGAAPRRVFPDGLMAGHGVIQIDTLANPRPEYMNAHGRVLVQDLQRGAGSVGATVDESRQNGQNIEPPLRP